MNAATTAIAAVDAAKKTAVGITTTMMATAAVDVAMTITATVVVDAVKKTATATEKQWR